MKKTYEYWISLVKKEVEKLRRKSEDLDVSSMNKNEYEESKDMEKESLE